MEELRARAIRMVFSGGFVEVELCFSLGEEEECRVMRYRALERERERVEEALAQLIGELNADGAISFEGESYAQVQER